MRFLYPFACLWLASCATQYGPASQSMRGGYSEIELIPGLYLVSFDANAYTKRGLAEDFALLRAAEICLDKGMPYIAVVDRTSNSETVTIPGGGSQTTFSATSDGLGGFSGNATTASYGPTSMNKPSAEVRAACQPEQGAAWDAAAIARQLREKYGMEATD